MEENFSNRNFQILVLCLSQLTSSVAAGRSWFKGEASGRDNGGWAEHSCLQCQQHYRHQYLHHKLHRHHQCLHCQHCQLHQQQHEQRKTGRSTDICIQRHTRPTDCTGAWNNHLTESINQFKYRQLSSQIHSYCVYNVCVHVYKHHLSPCISPLTALHHTSLFLT